MVSKCANPNCPTGFLYLHEGILFRFDSEGATHKRPSLEVEPGFPRPDHHIEFFWLCNECAAMMTLKYSRNSGVHVLMRAAKSAA
jgi:hypothetical protein